MRTKKLFIFDEEKEAQVFYQDGFPDGCIDYGKMYLIAKYIRQIFNFGEIRLERELVRFCQEQDANFNPVKEAESIRKWVSSAMKYNLRKIENLTISEKEITFLKNIDNVRDRKVIFCALLLSKALKRGNIRRKQGKLRTSDNYYIHYNNFVDIIHLSRLNNISETDLADILHSYSKYLTFYNPERELIRLNFVDKDPEKKVIVYDPSNMIDYFDILFERNRILSFCKRCGIVIKKNSNKQKYCKKCAKIVSNEKHKEIMRKKRALQNRN